FRRRMKLREDRGVTMVEFAIVIVPFFLLLFGTLELGFILWGTYDLENATYDAARLIRTGQLQSGTATPDQFRDRICNRASLLPNCTSKLRVDVRSYPTMSAMQSNPPLPLDGDGNLQDSYTWNTGGPASIVLVSAFYPWPLFNLTTSFTMSNMANGDRLLRTSVAFRNEPWEGN
ncbi:MAG TPA: TadE/TadG family type IV pilus assembly protein, partial [Hyphomicrobiales bacterium]|nr:TadE/TadG family type IV pilus assembly protein [Hyphomicrobiales bacterium]